MTTTMFQGDTYELFIATDFLDLDSATTIEIIVTKPSGIAAIWTAIQVDPSHYTDPKYDDLALTDQDITYTTDSTDLNELGLYLYQSHVEWGVDSEQHGYPIGKFKVIAHLAES
jgi:hypothetical protein